MRGESQAMCQQPVGTKANSAVSQLPPQQPLSQRTLPPGSVGPHPRSRQAALLGGLGGYGKRSRPGPSLAVPTPASPPCLDVLGSDPLAGLPLVASRQRLRAVGGGAPGPPHLASPRLPNSVRLPTREAVMACASVRDSDQGLSGGGHGFTCAGKKRRQGPRSQHPAWASNLAK